MRAGVPGDRRGERADRGVAAGCGAGPGAEAEAEGGDFPPAGKGDGAGVCGVRFTKMAWWLAGEVVLMRRV